MPKPPLPDSSTAFRIGEGGERHPGPGSPSPALTTNQGTPIADNQNSLRASRHGGTLLEDFILREKITHFDHERIPERIVHARGTAAHGYFELTKSLKRYTTAKVLSETGVRVPVFCRLSTVAGGAGSVDTPRDIRGFAVKFHTAEGNWDLVGNNVPVFFIQDAMKFPDLVHSVKMEPDRGFPQAASAHDTFWDFISLMPEAMHAVMWVMSDRAIPRSLRMVEGFGVHSFRLIDQKGDSTFVKFHWRPKLGLQSTLWDEAVKIAGADPDFHRRDMFESIQNGSFPEWQLAVQLFTEAEAEKFPFDHLDPTKLIPEELVPLTTIGRMVLNRYPDNFFAETEQVAFCPANVPPGIDFSNDPLLQGRLFSYLDTQLSRLGSPNFHQLPINAPKCPFANLQRDGHMQMAVPKGRVNYEPHSLQANAPVETPAGFRSFADRDDDGHKGRIRPQSFADHFSQPRMFYLSQTDVEQAHIAAAFVFELSKVTTVAVRTSVLAQLRNVDESLAQRIADGLAMPLPDASPPAALIVKMKPSRPLQIIGNMKHTLEGRTIGMLIDDGSDATTLTRLKTAIRNAGAAIKVIAPRVGSVTLHNGKTLAADCQLAGTPSVFFDAVVLLLAEEAGNRLAGDAAAVDFVRDAYGHLKAIAFDAGAQALLSAARIEQDAGIVNIGDDDAFVKAAQTRQWTREPRVRTLP